MFTMLINLIYENWMTISIGLLVAAGIIDMYTESQREIEQLVEFYEKERGFEKQLADLNEAKGIL